MNSVTCRICNKEVGVKGLGAHIQAHGIDYKTEYIAKYLQQYPKDFSNWRKCIICSTITKKAGNTPNYTTCSLACRSQHQSTLQKGRKAWNEGLTKDTHPGLRATSEKAKKRFKESHPRKGIEHTEEAKQKISETRIKNGSSKGNKNPMYGKKHTEAALRKIFQHRKMNKLEEIVANYLDDNNVEYTFQYFLSRNNICKSYDFKLTGTDILLEIDGDYWHGGPDHNPEKPFHKLTETKENDIFKEAFAKKHGYTVKRFWESALKADITLLNQVFSKVLKL